MTPKSQYDATKLMAGNTWVRFGRDPSDEALNQCYIFHKLTGKGEQTFHVQSATGTADLTPAFGSIFTIPQITFDAAGHLSEGKEIKVQLPENPGLTDINSLKQRIAALEDLVKGSHGDSGSGSGGGDSGEGETPSGNESILDAISALEKKINDWNMYSNTTDDTHWRQKEGSGIGSTLHEVMVELGLRYEEQYFDDKTNSWVTGYRVIDDANLNDHTNTIKYKANNATYVANNAARVTETTIKGIRSLLDYLVNTNSLGTEDRAYLIQEFFKLSNEL